MLRIVISSLLSFLIFLLFHFIDFFYFLPQEKVKSLLVVAIAGLICFVILLYFLPNEEWFQSKLSLDEKRMRKWVFPIIGAFFYGFLFLGYLEFYFTADRSITFRMLMIIDKQKEQAITREEMFELYDIPGIINKRFDDLVYGGYLIRKENDYFLTSKGRLTLSIYRFAIEKLHLNNSERKEKVM